MNPEGCLPGLVTDETFRLNFSPACSISLNEYDIAISVVLVIRFVTAVLSWHDWFEKKRRYAGSVKKGGGNMRERRRWEHRFPIVPSTAILLLICWILVFVLVRFNLSNGKNGLTMFFWTLAFNFFAVYSLLFQKKIVRLGKRVIPLSQTKLEALGASSNVDELQSFDLILRIIFLVELICVAVQTICGFVLTFALPNQFICLQVAFACEGIYMGSLTTALMYQMCRVISCVQQSTILNSTKSNVVRKIRSQQIHFFLTGGSGTVINLLLAAAVIPAVWYILLYWIILEALVSSFAVVEFFGSLCLRRRKSRIPEDNHLVTTAMIEPTSIKSSAHVVDAE